MSVDVVTTFLALLAVLGLLFLAVTWTLGLGPHLRVAPCVGGPAA